MYPQVQGTYCSYLGVLSIDNNECFFWIGNILAGRFTNAGEVIVKIFSYFCFVVYLLRSDNESMRKTSFIT